MPIAHIHSPIEAVTVNVQEIVQNEWEASRFLEELNLRGAQLEVYRRRFQGDITPTCFSHTPGLEPYNMHLRVGMKGKTATITSDVPPESRATPLQVALDPGRAVVRHDPNTFRFDIPEDGDALLIGQSRAHPLLAAFSAAHIGGLVLDLGRPRLYDAVAEHFPYVADL